MKKPLQVKLGAKEIMQKTLQSKRWLYFLLVAGGVLLSTMDSSMINVALPSIMRHFQIGLQEVKLVVLVYLMVVTFSLVFWGSVADRWGKGKIYLTGITLFVTGGVACSLATSFTWLIGLRCCQAAGAAMMMSSGPAILKITTPAKHLGHTLGMVGIATSLGLMTGPLVSGLLLTYFSWRAVFFISAPLGGVLILLGLKFLVQDLQHAETLTKAAFDWLGGIVWVAVVILYVALVNGTFSSMWSALGGGLACLACILVFIHVERASDRPILPLQLVRQRYFWTSIIAAAASFAALFLVLILMPFYLDLILGYSAAKTGATMMSLPLSLVLMSPFSGWLYDRFHNARLISTTGLLLSLVSVSLLFVADAELSFYDICLRLMLLGCGQSMFLAPNSASVLTQVADSYAGISSGILATARNFGMLTGAGLGGTVFSFFFARLTNGLSLQVYGPEYLEEFLVAQQYTLATAFALLTAGCVVSLLRN